MKIKNLICGFMGAIATVGAANALTTDEIKARCNNAANRVWDSKNSVCISKTPCKDSRYDAYCNRIFKDVQIKEAADAKKLIDMYLKKQKLSCSRFDMDEAHWIGQDRIRCFLSDGGYMEFEFDDYNESIQHTANYGFAKGLCLIYGGRPEAVRIDSSTTDYVLVKDAIALTVSPLAFAVVTSNALVDPFTKGSFLQCSYVSKEDCNEMYSGQAIYSEQERACLPQYDFAY